MRFSPLSSSEERSLHQPFGYLHQVRLATTAHRRHYQPVVALLRRSPPWSRPEARKVGPICASSRLGIVTCLAVAFRTREGRKRPVRSGRQAQLPAGLLQAVVGQRQLLCLPVLLSYPIANVATTGFMIHLFVRGAAPPTATRRRHHIAFVIGLARRPVPGYQSGRAAPLPYLGGMALGAVTPTSCLHPFHGTFTVVFIALRLYLPATCIQDDCDPGDHAGFGWSTIGPRPTNAMKPLPSRCDPC